MAINWRGYQIGVKFLKNENNETIVVGSLFVHTIIDVFLVWKSTISLRCLICCIDEFHLNCIKKKYGVMYRCFWILHFFDLNCWTQQSNIIFDKVFSEASGTNTIYFGVCLCFFSQLIECFQKWDSGYCNRCIWIWIRFGRFRVWITNGSYPSMMGVKLNSCQLNKCYLFYRIFVIRDDMVCFDVLFCTTWSCFSSGEDFVYYFLFYSLRDVLYCYQFGQMLVF